MTILTRHYNALLREGEHLTVKSNELLSTELHIFALIRLGISDNDQISKVLDYSIMCLLLQRMKMGILMHNVNLFITKSGKPIVSIGEPKAKATSIVVSGTIEDNGGFAITERGICYTTNTEPTKEEGEKVQSGAGDGSFDVNIGGLEHSKTYYLRAYAVNSKGTSYSESYGIATKSGAASVRLNVDKSTITASSVSSVVTITDDGSGIIQSCGVCWSENPNPTIQGDKVVAGGKKLNTQYICNITSMEPNSTYYLRAYATTEVTTEYSTQVSIKTIDSKPTVTTNISSTGEDYLVISGVVKTGDGAPITQQGICWSTIPNPTLSENVVYASGLSSPFSCRIDGLQKGTKYYCKAFAKNMYGTTLGNQVEPNTDYDPTILTGHVYDQDGNPISGATVMGYDVSGYSCRTDNNGLYSITLGSRMQGRHQFRAYASNYDEQILDVNINRAQTNQLDFTITLTNKFAVDFGNGLYVNPGTTWEMYFECNQTQLPGQTTTRNMRIKNYRNVPVSWSITNLPTSGITFSKSSGTISAQGEVSISVTFRYPSTTSYMVALPGCSAGSKSYIWNWDAAYGGYYISNGSAIQSACNACCWQNPIIMVDNYTEAFTLLFNQGLVWN